MLDALVRVFHELGTSHPRSSLPLLVRATAAHSPDDVDLGVLELHGQHPGTALLGFSAPDDCLALGVVTTGWSLPPERAGGDAANRRTGPPAAEAADRVAVYSTVLVGRGCEVAGRFSVDGGEPVDGAPEGGVLLDLLLRALGCPTAPPTFGVLELLATVWLNDVATDATRNWDWPKAAHRHLALQLRPDRSADELVVEALEVAAELGWAGVRRVVQRAGWPGVCSAEDAAWFDDGAFARWVLGSYPPVPDLYDAVSRRLRSRVALRVRAALEIWGLLA